MIYYSEQLFSHHACTNAPAADPHHRAYVPRTTHTADEQADNLANTLATALVPTLYSENSMTIPFFRDGFALPVDQALLILLNQEVAKTELNIERLTQLTFNFATPATVPSKAACTGRDPPDPWARWLAVRLRHRLQLPGARP